MPLLPPELPALPPEALPAPVQPRRAKTASPQTVLAQAILPNGAGTTIETNGDRIEVSGGTQAGGNLFHSFEQFNLNLGQTANFISNPAILNILGRITGGQASQIDGTLQISGSNANLFLLNPAGILFGPNARLNLPGAFTATTSDRLNFGNQALRVFGANNYSQLTGNPDSYDFTTAQPGQITNQGELSLSPAAQLNFIGGNVASSGSLKAGEVNVVAAPSQSQVRLGSDGASLTIAPNAFAATETIPPGFSTDAASESPTPIANVDISLQQLEATQATITASGDVILEGSQLRTEQDLTVVAGDQLHIRDSLETPFIAQAGGNLNLQGTNTLDILALSHPETLFQSGGDLTLISDNAISADAHFTSGGNFSLETLSGETSSFISLYDPIIRANGDVSFGEYVGTALKVEATGSINVTGDITITGPDQTLGEFTPDDPDIEELTTLPSLILEAGATLESQETPLPITVTDDSSAQSTTFSPGAATTAGLPSITVSGDIDTTAITQVFNADQSVTFQAGNITLTAPGNITAGNTETSINAFSSELTGGNVRAGNITVTSDFGDIQLGDINSSASGPDLINAGTVNISAETGNIQVENIETFAFGNFIGVASAGNINITSGESLQFNSIASSAASNGSTANALGGNVTLVGDTVQGIGFTFEDGVSSNTIDTRSIGNEFGNNESGTIQVTHTGGRDNVAFQTGDATLNGTAGDITTGNITSSNEEFSEAGQVILGNEEISITFENEAPELDGDFTLNTTDNAPISFTVAELNLTVTDADSDNTQIEIAAIENGTLSRNNELLSIGDTISETDTLTYSPTSATTENTATTANRRTAFRLRSSDGVAVSQALEFDVLNTDPDIPDVTDLELAPNPSEFTAGYRATRQFNRIPVARTTPETQLLGMPLTPAPAVVEISVIRGILPEVPLLLLPINSWNIYQTSSFSLTSLNGTNSSETIESLSISESELINYDEAVSPVVTDQPLSSPNGQTQSPGSGRIATHSLPNTLPSGNTLPEDLQETPYDVGTIAMALPNSNVDSPNIKPSDPVISQAPTASTSDNLNQPTVGIQDCPQEVVQIRQAKAEDRQTGIYKKLIKCFQQNLTVAEETQNSPLRLYALNNLGSSYFVIGEYLQAIATYEQQLATAKLIGDRTHIGIALSGLGAAQAALGDYDTAIQHYQNSLAQLPEDKALQWRGLTLRNLGNAYLSKNNYLQALEYQRQSLELSRHIKDRYGEMQSLGNQGNAYSLNGEFEPAVAAYNQSLKLAQALGAELEEAQTLLGLSATHAYQKRYGETITQGNKGLMLLKRLDNQLGQGIALNNIGDAQKHRQELSAAEANLQKSIQIWESLRAGLGNNDAYKVSIFETQADTYRNLQEVLAAQNRIGEALEVAEQGRGRAFIELLARGNAQQSVQDNAQTQLIPNLAELKQIAQAQNTTLVEYTLVHEQFVETPHGTAVQYASEPVDSKLMIWVIQPSGDVELRQVNLLEQLPTVTLQQLVEVARRCMNDQFCLRRSQRQTRFGFVEKPEQTTAIGETTAPRSAIAINPLQQLHRVLIAPIADLLPSSPTERVVFIPQDHLFLVPFPALQAQDNSYLIDHHTILTSPSIQLLAATQARQSQLASNPSQALVVGNPAPMPANFSPLPFTGDEANKVAQLLDSQPLMGAQATEAQVKQQLSQASTIHLATHGTFNAAKPLEGAIALAPGAGEDGLLSAAEVLNHRLKAQLVILSACDTGRGRITGDGVIGLSRSFLAAGASSVMVSLWKVPDDATAILMTEFHRQRLSEQSHIATEQLEDSATALRNAMLTLKEIEPDPKAWSGFTIIGAT